MSSTPLPSATLSKEIETIRELSQLLKQEQSCLIEADVKGLETLTGQKANLVARMSQLASLRHKALAAAGLAPEDASMSKWFTLPGQDDSAKSSWNELLELVRSTKELNRTNGLLIGTHMARTQTALQVLHGNTHGVSTYGSNGMQELKTSGRGFVAG